MENKEEIKKGKIEKIQKKIDEQKEEIEEFVSGQEEQNLKIASELFQTAVKEKNGREKSENFGKALGCLWAIYDDRPWYSKIFKNLHTGLKPLIIKIKKFVKMASANIKDTKTKKCVSDIDNVLLRSITIQKNSIVNRECISKILTGIQDKKLNEIYKKNKDTNGKDILFYDEGAKKKMVLAKRKGYITKEELAYYLNTSVIFIKRFYNGIVSEYNKLTKKLGKAEQKYHELEIKIEESEKVLSNFKEVKEEQKQA